MILDRFDLTGKTAVVTGCNSGIGQGIAVGLAEAGADIVAVHRSDISETKAMVEGLGRRFHSAACQISDKASVPFVVDETVKTFGKLDILVNNAGAILREDAMDYSEEYWDDVMNLNLKIVFLLSQAAARQMEKQGTGGKIISIASVLSFQGGIRVPAYTASKFGIRGLTMALANEWAAKGINVNAIAPGYVVTKNTDALREDEARYQAILERIPAGNWGNPEDFKGPAVLLASEAGQYIHGTTLMVDGGWMGR